MTYDSAQSTKVPSCRESVSFSIGPAFSHESCAFASAARVRTRPQLPQGVAHGHVGICVGDDERAEAAGSAARMVTSVQTFQAFARDERVDLMRACYWSELDANEAIVIAVRDRDQRTRSSKAAQDLRHARCVRRRDASAGPW